MLAEAVLDGDSMGEDRERFVATSCEKTRRRHDSSDGALLRGGSGENQVASQQRKKPSPTEFPARRDLCGLVESDAIV